jgi:hypothetical protein
MDHYNTKNTVIGCLTAIILVAIIAVAVVWANDANVAKDKVYKTTCIQAGKSIVAGNCVRLVDDR